MAGKAITKETIRKKAIEDMKKLGVYKPEYDAIIDVYSELREQYERLTAEYKKSNYAYSEKTESGGSKKAPIVATLESLRRDILMYSDRLCVNPRAMSEKRMDDKGGKKKISLLGKALSELEGE